LYKLFEMHILFHQMREEVEEHVSDEVINSMLSYLSKLEITLWGMEKPRNFLRDMLVTMLYKDLKNIGVVKLHEGVCYGYKVSKNSLMHNTDVIREKLYGWAKEQIVLGNKNTWNAAARNSSLGNQVKDTNLWIDSTDFPLAERNGMGKSSEYWSFKLNSSGQRFMTLQDAHSRVLKVWGGYSPKLYDGHFLRSHHDFFESLSGAKVIGDNHFEMGKKLFKNVKFYTNYAS